ncbi:MAG: AMP-binding protein [Rhodocyclaceae bacterium]|nr:AMP-binding protein [Rhodocyclaceae bacterium]
MNLALLLQRSAQAFPRQPAVALGAAVLHDYAGLAGRVARLAGGLRDKLGLLPGQRVALVMQNCPQYIELFFACWQAGLAVVPINAKLHPRELEFIFRDTAAGACFATAGLAEGATAARAAAPALARVVDVDSAEYSGLLRAEPIAPAETGPLDIAWLFYTSGTTGQPKGVMISHANLLAATLAYFTDVDAIAPGDSILHAAPMSHGSGLYILPHVAKAACNVAPESGGFDEAEIFELLRHHRGATLFAAPTMVKRLVAYAEQARPDSANLKTIVYGGGPMYVEDCKAALRAFGCKLAQIYGQGESPMTITAMDKALHADSANPRYEQRLASVGRPFTGIEVRVADADDRPLSAGEIGEVLVRGPTVMAGYLNNPEATAQTLRNGWLHTGDVGFLDEEGFLTLRDRSKDLIISGGSNIYPREVEEVLARHPAVAEAAVVGAPDAEWGEIVVACVVARPGKALTAKALDALCLDHIARFKRPKRYVFLDTLPKNATGKVLKTELRKRL